MAQATVRVEHQRDRGSRFRTVSKSTKGRTISRPRFFRSRPRGGGNENILYPELKALPQPTKKHTKGMTCVRAPLLRPFRADEKKAIVDPGPCPGL